MQRCSGQAACKVSSVHPARSLTESVLLRTMPRYPKMTRIDVLSEDTAAQSPAFRALTDKPHRVPAKELVAAGTIKQNG